MPRPIEQLGLGYAPAGPGLKARLVAQGFAEGLLLQSGLTAQAGQRRHRRPVSQPADGADLPRCRLGHRLRRPGDGRRAGAEVSELAGNADLLEGADAVRPESDEIVDSADGLSPSWWRAISILRRCFGRSAAPVVASCGTALTTQQAQLLRRFTNRVVLSYDPDAAGQGAAAKSCELLVDEGFDVNVAVMDKGEDPDTFIRRHGPDGYREKLRTSRPYLEYLLDQSAAGVDFRKDENRRQFLGKMLAVVGLDPRSGGPRSVRGSDRSQGANYGRGGSRGNPESRRRPPLDADRTRASVVWPDEGRRKRADLGSDP